MNNKKLPPYGSFFSVLRKSNPFENNYSDIQKLVNSGLTTEQAVAKLRKDGITLTGGEKYSYLQSVWVSEGMKSFKDFLMWHINKDVVPTLETMQKIFFFSTIWEMIC